MKFSREEYFSCYSPNLRDYLELNGFVPVHTFRHARENKTCWVFDRTPELAVYLEQWSENRKNIK